MKKKIFIVTEGCYSDYGIMAVFEDLESAADYVFSKGNESANDNGGYGYRIEVYDLGEAKSKSNRELFFVDMTTNGDLLKVENNPDFNDGIAPIQTVRSGVKVYCFADNKNHAIKIANEIRTDFIKQNYWNSDRHR